MRNADRGLPGRRRRRRECRRKFKLVVPHDSEIVQRRNKVLDLMKTRSALTGAKHTAAEYEAAKDEPVILAPQVAADWKAPHFVWQVRQAARRDALPGDPGRLPTVDTGGYKVITTLDWKMQQTAEKWVYVAARAPELPRTRRRSWQPQDPGLGTVLDHRPARQEHPQRGRRGHRLPDRPGPRLRRSARATTSKGNKKFQPQFDVLADGWRQPGSAIKPINYIIGIDDQTLTASTMFMDVTTDFGGGFVPTQADHLERGPVRLRSALQFSLNIPAIKAGDHPGPRPRLRRGPRTSG